MLACDRRNVSAGAPAGNVSRAVVDVVVGVVVVVSGTPASSSCSKCEVLPPFQNKCLNLIVQQSEDTYFGTKRVEDREGSNSSGCLGRGA